MIRNLSSCTLPVSHILFLYLGWNYRADFDSGLKPNFFFPGHRSGQIIHLNMVLVPYEYLGSWAPLVRKEDKVFHHKGFQMHAELTSTFAGLVWKCHLSVKD